MKEMEKLAQSIMGAVRHALDGHGPASVRVTETGSQKVAAVVFVIPGPAGEIVDDALEKLYDVLGWDVAKQGKGEVN
jgi:hypothetical protein